VHAQAKAYVKEFTDGVGGQSGENTDNRQRLAAAVKVPRDRAYGDYVSLLGAITKKLGSALPEEVEMILFANAEPLVDQVL
jgi:hypothetical protein